MEVYFENYDARKKSIESYLKSNGIESLQEAKQICERAGIDIFKIVKSVQTISFEDAAWAYIVGASVAIKRNISNAEEVAKVIGEGLQTFCIEGSIAHQRKIGLGHGNLAHMLLTEDVECFAFLAGHESFAAAEGAIMIAKYANIARTKALKVILLGLGKDAAEIIARINGFTYARTSYDFTTNTVSVIGKKKYSKGETGNIICYGADEMREGVAIMELEDVDVSISGNATNMIKFQHPVAAAYKTKSNMRGKKYYACASGGGIGRTLNPDDISAGPSSYGQTDMMAMTYADVIFAGSSSVPSHVEMMGFIGMGNNPMVGATVAISVEIEKYTQKIGEVVL